MRLRPLFTHHLKAGLAALLLAAAPSALAASASQLQASADQVAALLNGQNVQFMAPPRQIQGRTMLPLREVANFLGQNVAEADSQVSVGRLTLNAQTGQSYLGGVVQPEGSVMTVGNVLYVSAKLLSDALGANISFSDDTRSFTITALPAGGNPLAPQARFSTDKDVYAPGEKVVYTEYAFDPDGADITARRWTGKQDVFFRPGVYTVSLQVTNSRGLTSAVYSRTITVRGAATDSPLTFALKYATPGDSFPDSGVLNYPVINASAVPTAAMPLLFSDSPEAPTQSGVLYQDSLMGRARLLAYHMNALGRPARLYILARNLETRPVDVTTERLGETAPTRIESILGQVTLLDYFSGAGNQRVTVQPGQSVAIYASPTLGVGSGVNVMQDINAAGRVELTFAMLEDSLPPTMQVMQQLPYLALDGRHQRGTFPNAVRVIRAQITQLPSRLVIGDGQVDPAITGMDALTQQPMTLAGNYGVLYDIQVTGTLGTAVALSPRGGLYRGAMNVADGPISQTVKLPRVGNALKADAPTLLWRAQTNSLNIDFVPASGSSLPISLVFYRAKQLGAFGGVLKTYIP